MKNTDNINTDTKSKFTLNRPRMIYNSILAVIKKRDWACKADDEEMMLEFAVVYEEMIIPFTLSVDEDRNRVEIYSPLIFNAKNDKKRAISLALGQINLSLEDGLFVIDIGDGMIFYKIVYRFKDEADDDAFESDDDEIGKEMFLYMVKRTCETVCKFSDKIEALNEGKTAVGDFLLSLT